MSTETQPDRSIWQFLPDNWFSNRIFRSGEQIVALYCGSRNKLTDQPWKIISIGRQQRVHGVWSMLVGIIRQRLRLMEASRPLRNVDG